MRVVHDYGKRLSFVHGLKPPRHPGKSFQGLSDHIEGNLLGIRGGDGGQGVVDVEPAVQPQPYREPSAGRDRHKLTSAEVQAHAFGAHIGAAGESVGDDRRAARCSHGGGAGIVDVDRGVPIRIHHLEERALGRAVGVQRLVEIQMVLGQIGKHGRAEPAPVHAVQGESV